MQMRFLRFTVMLILALAAALAAQTGVPATSAVSSSDLVPVLERSLTGVERNMVSLADAMPEDKYGFAPTQGEFKGVRKFSEQIRHVAAANFGYGARILGEKPPMAEGEDENGPKTATKAEIMKNLKDSFAYLHKAIATINSSNAVAPLPGGQGNATRVGLAVGAIAHVNDHYGQCVVYLRMNGLIPPASRR